jgi:ATP/maltotriose-dependent transcriptional regulator MalT
VNAPPELLAALEEGNAAFARFDWEAARDHYQRALTIEASAEAYEGLSWAAWSLNDPETVFAARETAFRLYHQAQDALGAARTAMWLGSDYVDFRGELSIASGWRQRARRLLEGVPPAEEHGWLLLLEGDVAMLAEDDPVKARRMADDALKLGRELGVADIEILALAMQGFALVSEGDVAEGIRLLEEASAGAISGEMSHPGYVSWTLCYLIYACELVRDYDRAMEWCDKMREYSERSQMSSLRGICRVHLAGVLIWRGDWQAAEVELSGAAPYLLPRPLMAADGTVRLADLRHRQGRLEEAKALFREVEWHPLALLGLAELSLEEGRPKDAEELIERFLRQLPEASRTQRLAALELMARTQALLGDQGRAREALELVTSLSEEVATPPLRAAASFSAGALATANHDYERARACFEDAFDLYERSGAPYESARARLELASVLIMLGRLDRAHVEALAAHEMLKQLNSVFYAGRAAALLKDIGRRTASPDKETAGLLTDRQIEILRLISQGMNDREIAAALVVSEHTVHRHVANILQRLDVPSRAAAVAYLSARNLI